MSAAGIDEEGAGGVGSNETADEGSPEVVVGIGADAGAEAEAEAEDSDEDAIATRLSQRGGVPLRITASGHTVLRTVSLVQPCH